MRKRYLTPQNKLIELNRWTKILESAPPTSDRVGGRGYPDNEMIDPCQRINAIDGVCTLQSCVGHEIYTANGKNNYDGELWLWLSEYRALDMYKRVPILAKHPLIISFRFIWQPDCQEIVSIQWKHGNHHKIISVLESFFKEEPSKWRDSGSKYK